MQQQDLLTADVTPPRCDPRAPAEARPRLSRQCAAILALLRRQGYASNRELSEIALKYTSRISDLRKAGYDVECFSRCPATGETSYRLAPKE